jgi:ribosome maturation factor RimP
MEITSPGLERKLTRPDHYRGAIGSDVAVKARDDDGIVHRWRGRLTEADDEAVVVTIDDEDRRIPYRDITGAQTVFEWGPTPKQGGSKRTKKTKKK